MFARACGRVFRAVRAEGRKGEGELTGAGRELRIRRAGWGLRGIHAGHVERDGAAGGIKLLLRPPEAIRTGVAGSLAPCRTRGGA